jgi:glycosyltransferase involved in cell wall biosynthesis
MKKIAVIIDAWYPFIGGGQISTYEISKRIASQNNQIDIITRNLGADFLELPKYLRVIKLGGKTKPFNSISKIIFVFKSTLYVARNDYDLVHAQAFLPGISAWAIKKFKGIPIVFTVHGTSIGTDLNNVFKTWLERLILTKIKYSAQITVSRDFLRINNVNKNIIHIPNGVDIKDFEKVKNHVSKKPTLIYLGKLHPQKNLPNLINALSIVKKNIPEILLVIVGDGPQKDELTKQVKKLGLANNVIFKGALGGQEKVKLLKSSHIFILPSIYEGQPLTLLEAWAAKIPVIVTALGDNKYLVREGVNGFLISDAQKVEEIAGVIEKAFGNKDLSKMGQNGYNFVAKNFSWEKSANLTQDVYQNLLKAKN